MIGYFALGVCLLLAGLLLVYAFVNADPRKLARTIRIAGAAICGAGALYALLTGRLWLATLLGSGVLIALGRWPGGFPFPGGFGGFGGGPGWRPVGDADAAGDSSTVETAYLRMMLDHDSGEISGVVLRGAFAGAKLEELDFESLLKLLSECRMHDNQAAALLETYLDRAVGDDWRERARGQGGAGAAPPRGAGMTPEQAREILGVGPEASAEEIRAAYHRLMKKLHPDQGGSTYLASQINAAKDLLLGE